MDLMDDKQFIAIWTMHAPRVFSYILTLEPNRANAEDIFQETAIAAWENRAEFAPGSDFRAWAYRIAYLRMLNFVRRHRKHQPIDEQLLETLGTEAINVADRLEARLQALKTCLDKLSPRKRRLLELRYRPNGTVKQVAHEMTLSLIGAYKALQRIHEALFECIQRELVREDRG